VPSLHRSSSNGDRPVSSVLIRATLIALVGSRCLTLTVGCGPKDGEEGGHCVKGGDCGVNGHCDSGLSCGTDDICHPQSPLPPFDSRSPCQKLLDESNCATGRMDCRSSATPDPMWNGACVARASDPQGNTVFCCDESKPMCFSDGPRWPTEPALNIEGCPGMASRCHVLTTPPVIDDSFQCAIGPTDDAGWTSSCCVSGDVCFALDNHNAWSAGPGYAPQGACAAGEEEHFCTGNATLPPTPCHGLLADASPSAARAFCCPVGYAPPAAFDTGVTVDGGN